MQYTKLLKSIGLTPVQSEIMDFLFTTAKEKASIIAKKINHPRGVVYNSLDELLKLELITKKDASNQVSTFSIEHPTKLNKLFEQHEAELKQKKNSFKQSLPLMISNYNLTHNKPGVEFYEGIKGIQKVNNDVITATEVVYTFIDIKEININLHIQQLSKEHKEKRKTHNIRKKILIPNTKIPKEYFKDYDTSITEIKILPDKAPFESAMQIYNNKISYTTIKKDSYIGVIIEDSSIYKMHRKLFEILWEISKPLKFEPLVP